MLPHAGGSWRKSRNRADEANAIFLRPTSGGARDDLVGQDGAIQP